MVNYRHAVTRDGGASIGLLCCNLGLRNDHCFAAQACMQVSLHLHSRTVKAFDTGTDSLTASFRGIPLYLTDCVRTKEEEQDS